jgi:methyl-accepting chemotaxis protein
MAALQSPAPVEALDTSGFQGPQSASDASALQKLEPSANEILSHVSALELVLADRVERIESEARRIRSMMSPLPEKPEIVPPPLSAPLDRTSQAQESLRDALSKLRDTVTGVASAAARILESSRSLRALTVESERNIQGLSPFVAGLSGISDRMNLLALNLALLASRAGDAGSPFEQSGEELRGLFESTRRLSRDLSSVCQKAGNSATRAVEAGQDVTLSADKALERSRQARDELEGLATLDELLAQSLDSVRQTGNSITSEFTRMSTACDRALTAVRSQQSGLSEAHSHMEASIARLKPLSDSLARVRTLSESHTLRLRSELNSP